MTWNNVFGIVSRIVYHPSIRWRDLFLCYKYVLFLYACQGYLSDIWKRNFRLRTDSFDYTLSTEADEIYRVGKMVRRWVTERDDMVNYFVGSWTKGTPFVEIGNLPSHFWISKN